MSISDRIKIALDIRGLQMKDLAIKAGIPFSTLSDIMSGKRKKLDIQKARDISKALNCSLDYLVGEDCHYQDDIDTGHFYSSALKYERERCNFSLEDLSSETKIPASLLEAYEEGLTPISEFLLKEICDVYGKSINQFLFDNDIYDEEVPEIFDGDVDRYEAFKKARDEDGLRDTYAMQSPAPAYDDLPANVFPIQTKKVPLLGTIAAGVPIYADENFDGYRECTEDIDADFCLKIQGDSMIGARINDGDIVFIKKQPDVDNGEIAAVLIEDEATLKRVYKEKGSLILQAENPKYAPIVCTAESYVECRIMGKAVAFQSDIV